MLKKIKITVFPGQLPPFIGIFILECCVVQLDWTTARKSPQEYRSSGTLDWMVLQSKKMENKVTTSVSLCDAKG
jgi:hypothetical protein